MSARVDVTGRTLTARKGGNYAMCNRFTLSITFEFAGGKNEPAITPHLPVRIR
jgi:hypothetical protein